MSIDIRRREDGRRRRPAVGTPRAVGASRPEPLPPTTWRARLRRDGSLLIMTLPAMACCSAVFAYVPMLGNVIAFQNYSPYTGFLHSPFVGWANFERVFSNPLFLDAVENTLVITAFQLVFFFPVPIVLALLLNSVVTPRIAHLDPVDRLPAALLLVGAGGDDLPADVRRRRPGQPDAARRTGWAPGSTS